MNQFSIIIPTYNRAVFLPGAIQSVLSQTYINWELLIIDDGSVDNTKEIVSEFSDARIQYIYQKNAERSAARNNGIKHAKGDYVCFLDSDDLMVPDFLNTLNNQIVALQNAKQIYFCRVLLKKGDESETELLYSELPQSKNIVLDLLASFSVIQVSQAVIPRDFFCHNLFDERYSLWEDTHLFIRLLAQYPYRGLPINGVVLQRHVNSTVEQGMSCVKLKDVNRYVEAIDDLNLNYHHLFKEIADFSYFTNYIDAKLNMYLYQSRVNNQYNIAFKVALKMMRNRFNISNLITSIKLVIHYVKSCFKIR